MLPKASIIYFKTKPSNLPQERYADFLKKKKKSECQPQSKSIFYTVYDCPSTSDAKYTKRVKRLAGSNTLADSLTLWALHFLLHFSQKY